MNKEALITKNKANHSQIITLASAVASKIRISDISGTDIFTMLAKVYAIQGINKNNRPDELETKVLIEFIKKQFGRIAPAEFIAAFELAAAKKINVDWHFQTFSCNYLGQVLKAYEEQYRTKVVDYMNKNAAELQQSEPPTPSERKKIREAFVLTCIIKPIAKFRKGETKKLFFPCSLQKVFVYFAKAGLIKLTDDEKKEIKERNEKELRQSLEQISKRQSKSADQYQEKKEAIELLKPENQNLFEKKLQNICRLEVITLICNQNELETIEKELTK